MEIDQDVDTGTEEVVGEAKKEIPLRGTYESKAYKEAKERGEAGGETSTETAVTTETVAEVKTGEEMPTETSTETSSATTQTVEETQSEEDPFLQLSEDAGFEVKGYDDLVNNLKSRRDLEQQLNEAKKTLEGLDPLALDIDKAAKSGIDINQYWHARTLDPDKLQAKESLYEKFILENAQLVTDNPDHARKTFERDFKRKYDIINKDLSLLDGEDLAKEQDEVEFAKASLDAESKSAKRFLQDWKQKNVTVPQAKQQEVAPGISEEQASQIRETYFNQAKEFVSAAEAVEIAIGDKTFSYGVENHKKAIENDLLNPMETLARHGVDLVNNTIDPSKFGELLTAFYILQDGNFGKSFSEFSIEQFNKQTVSAKQTGAAPTQPLTGGAIPAKTTNQKVGESFRALREAKRSEG
jgi:hypothetical protein